jgi:hypothetical protein
LYCRHCQLLSLPAAHSWNMAESTDAEAAPAKKAKTAAK